MTSIWSTFPKNMGYATFIPCPAALPLKEDHLERCVWAMHQELHPHEMGYTTLRYNKFLASRIYLLVIVASLNLLFLVVLEKWTPMQHMLV